MFNVFLITITMISFFDIFLLIKYQNSILSLEQNPIGVLLLDLGNGNIDLFVACKLLGTLLVLFTLLQLNKKYTKTLIVAGSLTIFQCSLFLYLTLA